MGFWEDDAGSVNVACERKIMNPGGGLYGHPAFSCSCACDLVGAIATPASFHCNSGAGLSLAAPPLRLTEVVVYRTHEVFPLGGRGRPGIMRGDFVSGFFKIFGGWWVRNFSFEWRSEVSARVSGRGSSERLIDRWVERPSKHIARKGNLNIYNLLLGEESRRV